MITASELRRVARARAQDAEILLNAKRYDAAFYICGYSVELALKARICRTLKWPGFPEGGQEFNGLQSVKTHDLDVLLKFSGIETRVIENYFREWSAVLGWRPEWRYQVGQFSSQDATTMLTCTKELLRIL